MFVILIVSKQLYSITEIFKNSLWLLVYNWDFIILYILASRHTEIELENA